MNIEQLKEKTAYDGMPQVWQRGFNIAVREMEKEIEKLKAENERLKAAAKEVVDAESAITYAIIAPSADKFKEIVERRKRTLAEAVHTLRQQIKEQTK